FSWYTNPDAWSHVLLKPYDWGASVWELIKTTEETTTGVTTISHSDAPDAAIYDLTGRRRHENASLPRGIYIQSGKKIVK
ncbi:MAG: hypothetical protein IKI18_01320, partial [Prevotella sp.]|nr:hypothetical protein [Prevotella sp.]